MSAGRSTEPLMLAAFIALALAMTLKYFPGLENAMPYAGNVFQAIHPDAFPGDPIIGSERPIWEKPFQLSLFYALVKLGGEVWLDDRFVAAVYLGLAVASLAGIDRIVRLAGVHDLLPRLIVQLIFMRDHQIFLNKMYFAHQVDVNHVAFVIPIIIWLMAATFARKSLWLILILCLLVAATSVKMAPYVIAYSLIVAALNGNRRDRIVIGCVFAMALAAFYIAVTQVLVIPEAHRVELWNLIFSQVKGEVFQNIPFAPMPDWPGAVLRNAAFLVLCLGAMAVPAPRNDAVRAMRLFIGLGVATWLIAGLYFAFAPDALKLPHLILFSMIRSLRWPQTIAFILLLVALFHWLEGTQSLGRTAAAVLGLGVLLAIGPANHAEWMALFAASMAAVAAGHWLFAGRGEPVERAAVPGAGALAGLVLGRHLVMLVQALALTMGIAFAYSISARLPAWKTWAEHGVMGDNPSAQWIGITDYIRENTPADAVILPYQHGSQSGELLFGARYLATRGGRSIAVINEYSSIFDIDGWKVEKEHQELLARLGDHILNRDWRAARDELSRLTPRPDYLILLEKFTGPGMFDVLPFVEETRIRGYAILRRKS